MKVDIFDPFQEIFDSIGESKIRRGNLQCPGGEIDFLQAQFASGDDMKVTVTRPQGPAHRSGSRVKTIVTLSTSWLADCSSGDFSEKLEPTCDVAQGSAWDRSSVTFLLDALLHGFGRKVAAYLI